MKIAVTVAIHPKSVFGVVAIYRWVACFFLLALFLAVTARAQEAGFGGAGPRINAQAVQAPGENSESSNESAVCLVVCPPACRSAMEDWREHRERQGVRVVWAESAATAEDVRSRLKKMGAVASLGNVKPSWILLVGDCQLVTAENADPTREVPTFYREAGPTAKYGTTPTLAGDAPYGDWDGDRIPEIAVGRLPVDRPEELTGIVQRIIDYEESDDMGPWRDAVQITAGVGGFGFLIDKAIESATRSVLVASLPAAVRLAVTYASPTSPFNPGADRFFSTVLKRYHEGSLFWVYMGHGHVTELDKVPGPNGTLRPVLCGDDIDLLRQRAQKSPIAVLLACYSGAFDASVDCLAERMLAAPGGPIAVLAGSRVTMPYGNAIAAQGLMHAVYHHRVPTLGDAWLRAQRELASDQADDEDLAGRRGMVDILAKALGGDSEALEAERLEHLHLYNLLGDPALVLRYPGSIELTVPRTVRSGEAMEIAGTTHHGGTLELTVCYPPGAVPDDYRLNAEELYELANFF